jgi:hypothetical protein
MVKPDILEVVEVLSDDEIFKTPEQTRRLTAGGSNLRKKASSSPPRSKELADKYRFVEVWLQNVLVLKLI